MYLSRMFRAVTLTRKVRSGLSVAARQRIPPIISHLQRSPSLSHFVRNNIADVGAKNRIFSCGYSSSPPSILSSSDILEQMQSSCEDESLNPDLCETMLTKLQISRYTELRSKFPWLLSSDSIAFRQLVVNDLLKDEMADIAKHPACQAILDYTKDNKQHFSIKQVLNICRDYRYLVGESPNFCYQDLLAYVAQQIPQMDMECIKKFSMFKEPHEKASTCTFRTRHFLETWDRFRELYSSSESPEEIRMVAKLLRMYGSHQFQGSTPVEQLEEARTFTRDYVERAEATNDLDNMFMMFNHADMRNILYVLRHHWSVASERLNVCLTNRVLDILSQDDLCLSNMFYMYYVCLQTNTMNQFGRKLTNYLQLNHEKLDIIALSRLGSCMPRLTKQLRPCFPMIEEQILLHMSKIERLLQFEQIGIDQMVEIVASRSTAHKYVEMVCQYMKTVTIGISMPPVVYGLFRTGPNPLPADVYKKLLESIDNLHRHEILALVTHKHGAVGGLIADRLAKRILKLKPEITTLQQLNGLVELFYDIEKESPYVKALVKMAPKLILEDTVWRRRPDVNVFRTLRSMSRHTLYLPEVMDFLSRHIMENQQIYRKETTNMFWDLCAKLGYRPGNMSEQLAIILRDIELTTNPIHKLHMVRNLIQLNIYPRKTMKKISNIHFLKELVGHLQETANSERRTMRHLDTLIGEQFRLVNRALIFDCPEFGKTQCFIPREEDEYRYVINRRDSLPADFICNFVEAIGGPEFATCLSFVENSYLVDVLLTLKRPEEKHSETSPNRAAKKQVAVIYLLRSGFCFESDRMTSDLHTKIRHLSLMGYNPITFSYVEWDALESCSDKEKQSYIMEKLNDHLSNGDEQTYLQLNEPLFPDN